MKNFSGYTDLPATVMATPVPATCLFDNQDLLLRMPVARGNLQRWRKSGLLPYCKMAGKRFYKKSEVAASKNSFLMRLFIRLFMQKTYTRYKKTIAHKTGKRTSFLKLALHISGDRKKILTLPGKLLKQIVRKWCCYDCRTGRTDLYQNLKLS